MPGLAPFATCYMLPRQDQNNPLRPSSLPPPNHHACKPASWTNQLCLSVCPSTHHAIQNRDLGSNIRCVRNSKARSEPWGQNCCPDTAQGLDEFSGEGLTVKLQRPSTERSRTLFTHPVSILSLADFRVMVHPPHLPCGAENSTLQVASASGKERARSDQGVEDHVEYIGV